MNIHEAILQKSKHKVISGPFSGMEIDPFAISWGDGDIYTKLLGIYEEELNPIISQIIDRDYYKRIVNMGCAEGYYAVGMKIACPHSEVFAIDISDRALECVLINSKLNEVIINFAKKAPIPNAGDFWIIDIEGGENYLFDDSEPWERSNMLVEMHEWKNRNILENLKSKFENTHEIKIIEQGSRNPNKFDFLNNFSDKEKWQLVSENRPEKMRWIYLNSKMQ